MFAVVSFSCCDMTASVSCKWPVHLRWWEHVHGCLTQAGLPGLVCQNPTVAMEANEQESYVPVSFALCYHLSIPLRRAHACTCTQDSLNSREVQAHLYGLWVVFPNEKKTILRKTNHFLILFDHFRVCVYVCVWVDGWRGSCKPMWASRVDWAGGTQTS